MTGTPQGTDLSPARIDPIRAGLLCRCPSCGRAPLFKGFLRVIDRCAVCGHDYSGLNTGDGAAVFVMQIAGGLSVFTALYVQIAYEPPIALLLAVALPVTAALSLGLMRPGKGLMVALQVRDRAEKTRRGG